jgi:hypothetical protein
MGEPALSNDDHGAPGLRYRPRRSEPDGDLEFLDQLGGQHLAGAVGEHDHLEARLPKFA